MMSAPLSRHWYADRAAWRLIGLRYLPLFAGLNLAWEIAQLPLYTLWREGSLARIAFSVAHCTLGDAVIGTLALVIALTVTRAPELARWHWGPIIAVTTLAGVGYTAFSEWMNTVVLGSWAYSELMPVLRVAGVEFGLAPVAQWLLLPPLALWTVRPRD